MSPKNALRMPVWLDSAEAKHTWVKQIGATAASTSSATAVWTIRCLAPSCRLGTLLTSDLEVLELV